MERTDVRILMEPEELDRLEQTPCLVDARIEADYEAGHIPGALHLDTFEFSNEQTEGEQLDSVLDEWHEMFLAAGVPADRPVVFYDAGTENRGSRPAHPPVNGHRGPYDPQGYGRRLSLPG
jgi:3-mercaptopyruvate sulfurtransferase SseA